MNPSSSRPAPHTRRRIGLISLLLLAPLLFLDWGAIYSTVAYHPPEPFFGLEVRFPRAEWLPGPRFLFSPQACPRCRAGEHEACAQLTGFVDLTEEGTRNFSSPRSMNLSFGGTVSVESSAGGGQRIRCEELVIEGRTFGPDSFDCTCCQP